MRIFLTFLLVLVLGQAALAAPPAPAPDRQIVASAKTLLSGYEAVPSATDWARVGPAEQVAAALMALVQSERTIIAARATSSLDHFARPEVRVFLEARLDDHNLPLTLRGKAAIALAGAFGDDAADAIAPLFAAREPELREDAIRAYRRMVGPAAERFLLGRAAREPDPRLADLMKQASGRIVAVRMQKSVDQTLDMRVLSLPGIDDPGPVIR